MCFEYILYLCFNFYRMKRLLLSPVFFVAGLFIKARQHPWFIPFIKDVPVEFTLITTDVPGAINAVPDSDQEPFISTERLCPFACITHALKTTQKGPLLYCSAGPIKQANGHDSHRYNHVYTAVQCQTLNILMIQENGCFRFLLPSFAYRKEEQNSTHHLRIAA